MAIDKLALISGEPIECGLTIYQPTLREIRDFGESAFYSVFWNLCQAPWDIPSVLDDNGINFMEMTEWQLFYSMVTSIPQAHTKMIFGDLDFSKFKLIKRTKEDGSQDVVMYDENMIIDEDIYKQFIPYVRSMIGFEHTGKKAGNETTRLALIMDDRKSRRRNSGKEQDSVLYNGIISLVNTEECKYNYQTIWDMTLFQFTKSLIQIQGKKAACALLQGSMSGFCDTSKIPKKDFQWMYSDDKYGKSKGRKLFKGDSQAIQNAGAMK